MPSVIRHPEKRAEVYAALAERDGPECFYCRSELVVDKKRGRSLDHFIPKSKGGTRRLENLRLSCRRCNQLKGDMDGEEFLLSPGLRLRRLHLIGVQRREWNRRLDALGCRVDGPGFWHVGFERTTAGPRCVACGVVLSCAAKFRLVPCVAVPQPLY